MPRNEAGPHPIRAECSPRESNNRCTLDTLISHTGQIRTRGAGGYLPWYALRTMNKHKEAVLFTVWGSIFFCLATELPTWRIGIKLAQTLYTYLSARAFGNYLEGRRRDNIFIGSRFGRYFWLCDMAHLSPIARLFNTNPESRISCAGKGGQELGRYGTN
jgi:hypothetical protein